MRCPMCGADISADKKHKAYVRLKVKDNIGIKDDITCRFCGFSQVKYTKINSIEEILDDEPEGSTGSDSRDFIPKEIN